MKIINYCFFIILLSLTSFFANANNYKIMFLGDSITEGSVGPNYRCYLLSMLESTGHKFDSIGSLNSNEASCDSEHEGHSGWRADHLLAELPVWTGSNAPDIALIHLGTNDIWQGYDVESTVLDIAQIVNIFQTRNPNVVIFIAGIVPIYIEDKDQTVIALNAELKKYVENASTSTSKVFFVDLHTDFSSSMLPDGVHPDAAGAIEMANRWFSSINNYFQAI